MRRRHRVEAWVPGRSPRHRLRQPWLRKSQQGDGAIEDFDAALRLNPGNANALNNRAAAYDGKAQFDHALRDHDEGNPCEVRFRLRLQQSWRHIQKTRAMRPRRRGFQLDFARVRIVATVVHSRADRSFQKQKPEAHKAVPERAGDAWTLHSSALASNA